MWMIKKDVQHERGHHKIIIQLQTELEIAFSKLVESVNCNGEVQPWCRGLKLSMTQEQNYVARI